MVVCFYNLVNTPSLYVVQWCAVSCQQQRFLVVICRPQPCVILHQSQFSCRTYGRITELSYLAMVSTESELKSFSRARMDPRHLEDLFARPIVVGKRAPAVLRGRPRKTTRPRRNFIMYLPNLFEIMFVHTTRVCAQIHTKSFFFPPRFSGEVLLFFFLSRLRKPRVPMTYVFYASTLSLVCGCTHIYIYINFTRVKQLEINLFFCFFFFENRTFSV